MYHKTTPIVCTSCLENYIPVLFFATFNVRYRNRFWRESVFRGVELVKRTLDECYGVDKVSLVSAAFRWLNHHSKMSPDHNGELFSML